MLVGTISIEKSEQLSKLLKKEHIQHNVLNAKNHEREAEIIAQAGKFGAVTISTNMAGRGTDIMLGGNAEFLAKAEMKRMQFSDELIAEATGFAETDNQEILNARKTFQDLEKKYKEEIQARVIEAGIEIIEARITYLAYAPEIAAVMLQRQQASAIIDARKMRRESKNL